MYNIMAVIVFLLKGVVENWDSFQLNGSFTEVFLFLYAFFFLLQILIVCERFSLALHLEPAVLVHTSLCGEDAEKRRENKCGYKRNQESRYFSEVQK